MISQITKFLLMELSQFSIMRHLQLLEQFMVHLKLNFTKKLVSCHWQGCHHFWRMKFQEISGVSRRNLLNFPGETRPTILHFICKQYLMLNNRNSLTVLPSEYKGPQRNFTTIFILCLESKLVNKCLCHLFPILVSIIIVKVSPNL